jgi:hypothetical protein
MDNHTLVTGDNFYWNNIKKCQPILELHSVNLRYATPLHRL